MQSNMWRKGIYPIQKTFDMLGDKIYEYKGTIVFDGEEIKADSQRYKLFKRDGCKCCKCGLKAQYFALEKHIDQPRYHLNLYGVKNGKEVLFTKDHIVPKAKGGRNTMDNYQVMCITCNEAKSDK